jgi:hypothetical protein
MPATRHTSWGQSAPAGSARSKPFRELAGDLGDDLDACVGMQDSEPGWFGGSTADAARYQCACRRLILAPAGSKAGHVSRVIAAAAGSGPCRLWEE